MHWPCKGRAPHVFYDLKQLFFEELGLWVSLILQVGLRTVINVKKKKWWVNWYSWVPERRPTPKTYLQSDMFMRDLCSQTHKPDGREWQAIPSAKSPVSVGGSTPLPRRRRVEFSCISWLSPTLSASYRPEFSEMFRCVGGTLPFFSPVIFVGFRRLRYTVSASSRLGV